ncbi:hypothetical protein RLOatenuis_4450 [Rickettsiales bacterium]|nr:hypothetical protein RLOatenuis_4450 [Rickettsiales bacterium]
MLYDDQDDEESLLENVQSLPDPEENYDLRGKEAALRHRVIKKHIDDHGVPEEPKDLQLDYLTRDINAKILDINGEINNITKAREELPKKVDAFNSLNQELVVIMSAVPPELFKKNRKTLAEFDEDLRKLERKRGQKQEQEKRAEIEFPIFKAKCSKISENKKKRPDVKLEFTSSSVLKSHSETLKEFRKNKKVSIKSADIMLEIIQECRHNTNAAIREAKKMLESLESAMEPEEHKQLKLKKETADSKKRLQEFENKLKEIEEVTKEIAEYDKMLKITVTQQELEKRTDMLRKKKKKIKKYNKSRLFKLSPAKVELRRLVEAAFTPKLSADKNHTEVDPKKLNNEELKEIQEAKHNRGWRVYNRMKTPPFNDTARATYRLENFGNEFLAIITSIFTGMVALPLKGVGHLLISSFTGAAQARVRQISRTEAWTRDFLKGLAYITAGIELALQAAIRLGTYLIRAPIEIISYTFDLIDSKARDTSKTSTEPSFEQCRSKWERILSDNLDKHPDTIVYTDQDSKNAVTVKDRKERLAEYTTKLRSFPAIKKDDGVVIRFVKRAFRLFVMTPISIPFALAAPVLGVIFGLVVGALNALFRSDRYNRPPWKAFREGFKDTCGFCMAFAVHTWTQLAKDAPALALGWTHETADKLAEKLLPDIDKLMEADKQESEAQEEKAREVQAEKKRKQVAGIDNMQDEEDGKPIKTVQEKFEIKEAQNIAIAIRALTMRTNTHLLTNADRQGAAEELKKYRDLVFVWHDPARGGYCVASRTLLVRTVGEKNYKELLQNKELHHETLRIVNTEGIILERECPNIKFDHETFSKIGAVAVNSLIQEPEEFRLAKNYIASDEVRGKTLYFTTRDKDPQVAKDARRVLEGHVLLCDPFRGEFLLTTEELEDLKNLKADERTKKHKALRKAQHSIEHYTTTDGAIILALNQKDWDALNDQKDRILTTFTWRTLYSNKYPSDSRYAQITVPIAPILTDVLNKVKLPNPLKKGMQEAKQGLKEAKKALGGRAKKNPEKLDEGIQRSGSLGSAGKKEPEAEGQMRGHSKSDPLKSAGNAESRDALHKEGEVAAEAINKTKSKKEKKIAKKSIESIEEGIKKENQLLDKKTKTIQGLQKEITTLEKAKERQEKQRNKAPNEKKTGKISKKISDIEGRIKGLERKKIYKEETKTKLQKKITKLNEDKEAKLNAPPPEKEEREGGDKKPKKKWSCLVSKVKKHLPGIHKKVKDPHVTEDKGNGPSR